MKEVMKIKDSPCINHTYLEADHEKILPIIESMNYSFDLVGWIQSNIEDINNQLMRCGAVLFRNFNIDQVNLFRNVSKVLTSSLISYTNRSTPRLDLGDNIYTSTEYSADFSIPLHNECSYSHIWPRKIIFGCIIEPQSGGETPIADSRMIYKEISEQTKKEFNKKNVLYIRNYDNRIGLSWQNVFQTDNKNDVEDYCRRTGIRWEWGDNTKLKTYQISQATIDHPDTREKVWFNQAHLFNISCLNDNIREQLLNTYKEEDLPRNSYFGNGEIISHKMIKEILDAYDKHTFVFSWKKGDILLLDNILFSHGRKPYTGDRQIIVAMGE